MDRQGIANFADLSSGNLLPSDGHHSSFGGQMPTDRQQALQAYQTVYEELAADRQMLFDNGYGYTFPYATDLTGLPVASSGYALFDEDIPFVQLAVHGSFVYTAPADQSQRGCACTAAQKRGIRLCAAVQPGDAGHRTPCRIGAERTVQCAL